MNLNQLIGKKARFYSPGTTSVAGILKDVNDEFITVERVYTDISWRLKVTKKSQIFFLNKARIGKIELL